MTARKRFTEREVLLCLLEHGAHIPCGICKKPIKCMDAFTRNVERDHYIPRALDGADDWKNCQYVHKACHALKTTGLPATSYGSARRHI